MRLKILHVINSLQPGGAENLLVNSLSPGGLQEHADNDIVLLRDSSYLVNKLAPDINVHDLNYRGKFDLPQMLMRLRSVIKKGKYNIIHSHLPHAGLYTALVCPTDIPHIHTIHSTYSLNKKNRNTLLNYIDRKLLLEKRNAKIIVISEYNKEDLLRDIKFKGEVFVLNNFIEDKYFSNTAPNRTREENCLKVIAVGNLTDSKNYKYIVEIFSHLKDKNIFLDIFGNGDVEKYKQVLNQNNITSITFMGAVPNIYDHIKDYDLFIMASKYEGFGLAVFEAMASGVPVIISNIPSLRTLVKNHAIYFDLNDAKGAAERLVKILNEEIDAQSLVADAKNYAAKIAKRENYIYQLLKIYNEVISTNV